MWNVNTKDQKPMQISSNKNYINLVAISSDGNKIVTKENSGNIFSETIIYLYTIDSYNKINKVRINSKFTDHCIAHFNKDNTKIIFGCFPQAGGNRFFPSEIFIWDIATHKKYIVPLGEYGFVGSHEPYTPTFGFDKEDNI